MKHENKTLLFIPVMMSFFVMGFVDIVGIATNYIKADFHLSDFFANLFPSMIFLWFFLLSIPTSMLMNKLGCRKTVLLSVVITSVALLMPCLNYSLGMMLVSFSLLGIGNTLIQVSLNPLVANIVHVDKLAGALTLGQFMKAIASFSAPVIAGWMLLKFDNWIYIFPCFIAISLITILGLSIVSIQEQKEERHSSFMKCLSLLGDKLVLILFLGIVCHVGIDVGINMTLPRILMERVGSNLAEAGYASSIYFLFRTVGCFAGAFILMRCSGKIFFKVSLIGLLLGLIGLLFVTNKLFIYLAVVLIGLGNSNIFSIIFSQALLYKPEHKNEISGLMIMGLSGGAVSPVFMGLLSDWVAAQWGAILILCSGTFYLFYVGMKLRI